MPAPVTVSVDVPQRRADVYAFLDVMANHESFTDHMLVDWHCSGPASGLGARASVTAKAGGVSEPVEFEVVAVVHEVEARQRAAVEEIDPALPLEDAMRSFWRHISDPSLWGNERLFFELYGQALQGRPGTTELLDGIVDAWLEPAATILARHGFQDGPAAARLGIAVTRGLLLDLLATGDRQAVDAAMETYIELVELRR